MDAASRMNSLHVTSRPAQGAFQRVKVRPIQIGLAHAAFLWSTWGARARALAQAVAGLTATRAWQQRTHRVQPTAFGGITYDTPMD